MSLFKLHSEYNLSGDQGKAVSGLLSGLAAGKMSQVLRGVTGSGKTEVYFEAVAEALRHISRRCAEHHLHVQSGEDYLLARIDAKLIVQVLINIMENAVLHGQNTTRITLTLTQDESWVSIAVEDDGGGVDPKIIHKILDDSFSQIREERSDMKRNMGIGLSVCQSIIRAHSGFFAAGNAPEGGAVFRFGLPMEEEKDE